MERYCHVPGCQRLKTKNLSLHYLPQNKIDRSIWVKVLNLNVNSTKKLLVCSRHFSSSDFVTLGYKNKIKRLKRNVMPSRNLPCVMNHWEESSTSLLTNSSDISVSEVQPTAILPPKFMYDEHTYSKPFPSVKKNGKNAKKKYPAMCCVSQCQATRGDNVSLHKFPSKPEVALIWKRNLNIKKQTKYLSACDKHFNNSDFLPGTSQNLRRRLKLTAVPMKFPKKRQTMPKLHTETPTQSALFSSEILQDEHEQEVMNVSVSTEHSYENIILNDDLQLSQINDTKHTQQDDEAVVEVKIPQMKSIGIQCNMFCKNSTPYLSGIGITSLIRDDDELKAWTNIPNRAVLGSIVECLEQVCVKKERKRLKLSSEQIVIMVFIKLKLNLPFVNLATLFQLKRKSISNYFFYILPYIRKALSPAKYWPSTEEIRKNLPIHFKGFESCRVVLDCFEVNMATLKCLSCRILTYSNYKKHHTVKFLLGVTPAGLISFISQPYSGRASDKLIFNNDHFLSQQEFNPYIDSIMVDKGFCIEEECCNAAIKLIRPPFLRNKPQLSPKEAEMNVKIAKARVHVERAIQRIRKYNILRDKIDVNILPWIQDIGEIVCCMVNLSPPILSDARF